MSIEYTCVYNIYYGGKFGPTSFIAFFSILRVQCGSDCHLIIVNHTYARQVLLGCAHFTIPPATTRTPFSGHFFCGGSLKLHTK